MPTTPSGVGTLDRELRRRGIPIIGVRNGSPPVIDFDPAATTPQRNEATTVAATWSLGVRRLRNLADLRTALAALSTPQKNAIWSALSAGTPPLWATDRGVNAGGLAVLQFLAVTATLSTADVAEAKLRAATLYVQDNPYWLISPAFDATINVPGYEPAV